MNRHKAAKIAALVKDGDEWLIDEIIEHVGTVDDKKKMDFRVRWFGFSPEEDGPMAPV